MFNILCRLDLTVDKRIPWLPKKFPSLELCIWDPGLLGWGKYFSLSTEAISVHVYRFTLDKRLLLFLFNYLALCIQTRVLLQQQTFRILKELLWYQSNQFNIPPWKRCRISAMKVNFFWSLTNLFLKSCWLCERFSTLIYALTFQSKHTSLTTKPILFYSFV